MIGSSLSAIGEHYLVLDKQGKLIIWGNGDKGKLGIKDSNNKFEMVEIEVQNKVYDLNITQKITNIDSLTFLLIKNPSILTFEQLQMIFKYENEKLYNENIAALEVELMNELKKIKQHCIKFSLSNEDYIYHKDQY